VKLMEKDMDLVVLIDDENAGLDPSHLVQMMGDLLERVSSIVPVVVKADESRRQILLLNHYQRPEYQF